MDTSSLPSADLPGPRCGKKGAPMNRSDLLIAYTCTACKHRWLVDRDHRAGVSFDALEGESASIKPHRIRR
jgi:hypothetical protein